VPGRVLRVGEISYRCVRADAYGDQRPFGVASCSARQAWNPSSERTIGPECAANGLAMRCRRECRREEWDMQRRVAGLLRRHLPAGVFATALGNTPRGALSGMFQRLRGTRAGLPVVQAHFARAVTGSPFSSLLGKICSSAKQFATYKGRPGQCVH
jgi:hypothetical protein